MTEAEPKVEIKRPDHFTDVEGGPWMPWRAGWEWDPKWLDQRATDREDPCVTMGDHNVHSVRWGALQHDAVARWDCVNGWTQEYPDDAQHS